jgi:protease-4
MPLPRRSHPVLLELDLTEPMTEAQPADPLLRPLGWGKATLRNTVRGLRLAREDPHVLGLIVRTGGAHRPLAQAQELRDAVAAFRAAGKPAVTWAETYGELGLGTVAYYLASVFDAIWLQPSGDVGITGLAAEATFLRDALHRAGLEPQFEARHEYKNAPNMFTEQAYTATHREATGRIVDSALAQMVAGIAEARRLTPEQVRALVDQAPLSAGQALAAGLVDHLGYRDQAYAAIRATIGRPAKLSYLGRYVANRTPLDSTRRAIRRDKRIVALVDAIGAIRLGRSGPSLLGAACGADTVNASLRAAIADDHVRAIVLRVDSPGGSYVASDAIWRTTRLARKAGKPLVVSMGGLAASGGYFISMDADRIVAQPGTLTGSIGVFGGKVVTAGLLDRVGIGHDAVTAGEHARIHSPRVPFDAADRAMLVTWLDRVYDDFTAKVAAGRGLTREAVHEVARGRVWTGADAAERGLVDTLGGLDDAVRIARAEAGLPADAPVRVFPQVTLLERVMPPTSSEAPGGTAAAWLPGWGELAAAAARAGLPTAGPLTMPGFALLG